MSEAPVKYRKLPGRGRRNLGFLAAGPPVNTLWLGPDHLLSVDRVWMNEEFKRFYFRDIQAITIVETDGRAFWNAVLGCGALLTVVMFGIIVSDSNRSSFEAELITGGCLTALWLVLMLINGLRGPCCICTLQTAVQREVLASLGRAGRAERVIALVRPLIESAQDGLSVATEPGRPQQGMTAPSAPPPLRRPLRPMPQSAPPRRDGGIVHALFFTAFIVSAVLGLVPIHFGQITLAACTLAQLALGIAALARQQRSTIPARLRRFTIATFCVGIVLLITGYFVGIFLSAAYIAQHRANSMVSFESYRTSRFETFMYVIEIIEFCLGAMGLAMALPYCFRQENAAAQPEASVPQGPQGQG